MDYQVGEQVRIITFKKLLALAKQERPVAFDTGIVIAGLDNFYVSPEMFRYCGELVTITYIEEDCKTPYIQHYDSNNPRDSWAWPHECLQIDLNDLWFLKIT